MNEKISYIKLPNITTNKLQDVVDFLEDNEIEYEEYYAEDLQNRIDKAIKYYEANQQECVIGRNKDDKLIKEYYLPAQCSKKMLDILKESGE